MPFRSRPTGSAASSRVVALLGVPVRSSWEASGGGWIPVVPGPATPGRADAADAWWTGAPDPDLHAPCAGVLLPEDLLWSPPVCDPADGRRTTARQAATAAGRPAGSAPEPTARHRGDWLPGSAVTGTAVRSRPPRADGVSPEPEDAKSRPAVERLARTDPPSDLVLEGPTSLVAMLRSGRVDPGRRGAVALVLLGVVAAAIAAVVLLRARPSEQPLVVPLAAGTATSGAGPQVVVDIAGKVRRPGLVRLPVGSRVDDVLKAAGGVLPGASTAALNLARKVADGEQVLVGDVPPAGTRGGASATSGGVVDLNLATATDLEELPGIGPVLADRIVSWRTEHGGRFASIDQLREVSGIGESKFQALKSKVRI